MTAERTLAAYRGIFVTLIIIASFEALVATHATHHALLLAPAEIVGALLLGFRRTQGPGAALLVLVFATAQVVSLMEGNWTTHFLQYGASAMFIVLLDRAR